MLERERYSLIELCEEYAAQNKGPPSTFIDSLKDGTIKTCIYFPRYAPRKCLLPPALWESLDRGRISAVRRVLEASCGGVGALRTLLPDIPSSFTVDSDDDGFPDDEELVLLRTVQDAIIESNVNKIHERYVNLLIERGIDLSAPTEEMWVRIHQAYREWAFLIDDDCDYEVYVARENIPCFFGLGEKGPPLERKRPGRPQSAFWEEVYIEALTMLFTEGHYPREKIPELAGKICHNLAQRYPGQGNALLQPDTIASKFRKIHSG
ncbi:hypothetical protein [Azospirillum argentinense]|uniref:hypothetical protein n=1 Tax=Azospirillum argentinense TaxID=2970906 RepID=UPI0032DFF4BE